MNKYRRSGHFKGEYPCTVTTRGLMIFPQNPKERPDFVYGKFADRIAEKGWFGQKTGRGWYRYEPGSRKPIPDR